MMRILIVVNAKIPVSHYGGTQRDVWYLAKELHSRGYQVTLLAAKGSYCPYARVIEINPLVPMELQIPDDVDVVNFHSVAYPNIKQPYIVTIHGNEVNKNNPNNSIYVSRNHAERYGSTNFVYNGMDWDVYSKVDHNVKREYYHFLGKAAWKVKNLKGAIRIVEANKGEKLMVMGGNRLNFKMGFRFTWSRNVSFCGMVDDKRKCEVIQRSKGLIFPVLWDEPMGLAVIESLYMGSPVFASDRGSLPELVTPDVGFLSNSETELSEAMRNANYSSKVCHEYARDCFSSKVMADGYLRMYEKVLNNNNSLED